jgi:allantoate deiminase
MVRATATGGARAVARCDALALPPYSDSPEGLTRTYLSRAYYASHDQVATWMAEAGMSVRRDAAMNLIGRYEGRAADAPALVIGSHIDSVRHAGSYDGPLGIMLGIEAVAALSANGARLPFAVEVYAFGDEEGSRFPAAMLTSRAVAGTLDPAALMVRDRDGVALADLVDVAAYPSAARTAGSVLAYLEAHIEQGPVLEAEGLAVGTVTGIAAQLRFEIELTGMAGHAGTTAMGLRADAVAGMAEMVLAAEATAKAGPTDLVATVGVVTVPSGAPNVIAGKCAFALDVRAASAATLATVPPAVRARPRERPRGPAARAPARLLPLPSGRGGARASSRRAGEVAPQLLSEPEAPGCLSSGRRTRNRLRHKRRVVVAVVAAVQRVPVQRPVEPVVEELRRAGVPQGELQQPQAGRGREAGETQAGQVVHRRHHQRLQQDEVVPLVLRQPLSFWPSSSAPGRRDAGPPAARRRRQRARNCRAAAPPGARTSRSTCLNSTGLAVMRVAADTACSRLSRCSSWSMLPASVALIPSMSI